MITLVKHHVTSAGMSPAAKEDFQYIDKALVKFYEYLKNYSADESVIRADVVLLNDSLVPCKTEHFVREIPQEEQDETNDTP